MSKVLESITFLVKVQQAIIINERACYYDDIIAQCTDLSEAISIANKSNAKIERHMQAINNPHNEEKKYYS